MRSGRLNKRIIIQQLVSTQNEYGEPTEQWVLFLKVWAAVIPLAGRKYYDAQQANSEITTEIRIRFTEHLSTRMRVLSGNEIYDIKSIINPNTKGEEMILMCKALL